MKVYIRHDKKEVARTAYAFLKARLNDFRINTVGFSASSALLGLYHEIAEGFKRGELDFAGVHAFCSDEFLGLAENNPRSRRQFLEENLFQYTNLEPRNIHSPNGLPEDIAQEADSFESEISYHGGVKLWILDIGRNGRMALNEPGTSLESRTGLTTLSAISKADCRKFFDNTPDHVPPWGMSIGLGTILDGEECLVIATGEEKADAVAAVIEGPLAASCPASVLQQHKDTTVILDASAASKLSRFSEIAEEEKREEYVEDYLERARRAAGLR